MPSPSTGDDSARLNSLHPVAPKLGGDAPGVRAGLALILAVTALVYTQCLRNSFVFDDHEMIVLNRYLGDWSFIWKSAIHDSWWFLNPRRLPQGSYYRPLQDLWLWINFKLFELHPAGWHAAMIALHLIVVLLAFRVTVRVTGDGIVALIASALFALMPIHAEAIVWPTAIPIPLSAAFELAAFDFFLRGRFFEYPDARDQRWRSVSMGLFGCALLTHESAIVFPLLIAAYDLTFPNRPDFEDSEVGATRPFTIRARGSVAIALPYAVEAAVYLGVRFAVLGFFNRPSSRNHMTMPEIILTIPHAIASYATILVMPWLAGPAHRMDLVTSGADIGFILPALGLAALGGAATVLLRRHPGRRLYLFCTAWMLITLAPVLNLGGLVPETIIQDRYLYLPSFGFCVMAADLASSAARGRARGPSVLWIGTAAVAVLYGNILFSVQQYWRDEIALFTRCIEQSPEGGIWHNRLGLAYSARGDFSAARRELETAANYEPDDGTNYYNLALVDEVLGDRSAAKTAISQWLKLLDNAPPNAYTAVALVADAAGDSAAADAALKQAAAMPDGAEPAALARAQLLLRHGKKPEAERALRAIIERDAGNDEALVTLGGILASDKRYDEALADYRQAEAIAPEEPSLHYKIALAFYNLGRIADARDECEIALRGAPYDRNIHALMAAIEQAGATR